MTNSRNKGASFEREIANTLNDSLGLKKPLKRILEQTMVCSKILFKGFFNPKESLRVFAISLSKDAPLFLELVIKQNFLQKILRLNVHFVHHLNLLNFPKD